VSDRPSSDAHDRGHLGLAASRLLLLRVLASLHDLLVGRGRSQVEERVDRRLDVGAEGAALDALRRKRGLHPVHDALAKRGLANAGAVCGLSQRRPLDRRREHGRLLIRRQRAERPDHLGHHALRCRLIARKPVLVDLERSIETLRGLGARGAKHAAVAALLRLRGQVFLHGRRLSSCKGHLELLNSSKRPRFCCSVSSGSSPKCRLGLTVRPALRPALSPSSPSQLEHCSAGRLEALATALSALRFAASLTFLMALSSFCCRWCRQSGQRWLSP